MERSEEKKTVLSENFLLFLRANVFVLFLSQWVNEGRWHDVYRISFGWVLWRKEDIILPLLPWLPPELTGSIFFREVILTILGLGCALVFFFPRKRLSYIIIFLGLFLVNSFFHPNAGVHVTVIYFIPFLYLALFPPVAGKEERARQGMIVALVSMYLFSALNKLTTGYLSGEVMSWSWPTLMHFSILPYRESEILKIPSMLGGIGLELMATLIFFSRFRKWGLAGAILFHTGISIVIIWAHYLMAYSFVLPFLFAEDRVRRREFYQFCIVGMGSLVAFYLAWSLLYSKMDPSLANSSFEWLGWVWTLIMAAIALWRIFKWQIDMDKVRSSMSFGLACAYAAGAFIFAWPEPLGYTQYSGRSRIYYGAQFRRALPEPSRPFPSVPPRWNVMFQEDENLWIGFFATEGMREAARREICLQEPSLMTKEFSLKSGAFPLRKSQYKMKIEERLEKMNENEISCSQ